MGISSGGMTLLHLATQQPDRVEAMSLVGPTIYFPEQARVIKRKTNPTNTSRRNGAIPQPACTRR